MGRSVSKENDGQEAEAVGFSSGVGAGVNSAAIVAIRVDSPEMVLVGPVDAESTDVALGEGVKVGKGVKVG